ncbi:HAD family hydrolase [Parabacteroides sp. Marseille-P3160]|uniref:HAD family hydrolase n=1 Tax=Parabacteroides sp. Marseille-P3160 TaxID=1917887 RepID=UPI0009BC581E|nr:HAD family hydrolase [Parabacteroides sp. Marseille-P3160]
MFKLEKVKGILFDYGGTIDSNGRHWSEVIWEGYQNFHVPVDKENFREAYVFAEQTMGKSLLVLPEHNFLNMMEIKIDLQMMWLLEQGFLKDKIQAKKNAMAISFWCYGYAKHTATTARPIIEKLCERYPLVLVSNFYGNISTVLKDFELDSFFPWIIESAVIGIRKPDPAIFRLGVEKLQLPVDRIAVIGDSYSKDIVPAASLGCQTIWLKNKGWCEYSGKETADAVITDFSALEELFKL